jgi:hypothetical protein
MRTESSVRFKEAIHMNGESLKKLVRRLVTEGGLSSEKSVFSGKKAMMFLQVLCGHSLRVIAERWQHSISSVSYYVHEVLNALDNVDKAHFFNQPTQETQFPLCLRQANLGFHPILPRRQDPAKCYWLRLESLRWKVLPK